MLRPVALSLSLFSSLINLTGPLCMVAAVSLRRSRMARYEQWAPPTTGDLLDKSWFWRHACSYRQCELRQMWRKLQLHDKSWSQHRTAEPFCVAWITSNNLYWAFHSLQREPGYAALSCILRLRFWQCCTWTRWGKMTFEEEDFFRLWPWRLCMKYNVAKRIGRWFDVLFWSLAFGTRGELERECKRKRGRRIHSRPSLFPHIHTHSLTESM